MRITLPIALGISSGIHFASASFQSYNCGPCVPMMPCPCPMASMAAPMMMQAPQMIMQAPPMVMQVASQAAVRPCNTQAVAISSSESSSSNSVTGPTFNTGDISSVIKEILKAELTGHWSHLMEAISNFNSQSDSRSVTNNYYTQNNRADISHNWAVFIQGLISRLEQQPNRSPQDERNLRILDRLRDRPPMEDHDTQTIIIADPAPAPPRDVIVVPPPAPVIEAPLAIIPPLAIGWIPEPTDLIPAYANDVSRSFNPVYNPLVDYLRLYFAQVCEDSLCRAGAESLARMVVFINYMTNGTGTQGLPARAALGDWVSVAGPARDDVYIRMLRDALNKFHHSFCLGNAGDRCNQIKPTLVSYLTRLLSVETALADDIRSVIIILLTNGSNSLEWARIMDRARATEAETGSTAGTGPRGPLLIKDKEKEKEELAEAAKKLDVVLSGKAKTSQALSGKRDVPDVDNLNKINNMITNIVQKQKTPSPAEIAFRNKFALMTQKEQIDEIMRLLDVRVKQVMGINDAPGGSAGAAAAINANNSLIDEANRDAEARRVAQQLQGLGGVGAGLDKVEVTNGKADLIVAAPEKKGSAWTKIYGVADAMEDDGGESVVGDAGQEPESRLVMYKAPKFVFAHHLSQFLKKGVQSVLPKDPATESQLVIGRSARPLEGPAVVFDQFDLNEDGKQFRDMLAPVLKKFCQEPRRIGDASDCVNGAVATSHLLALIDQVSNFRGLKDLPSSDMKKQFLGKGGDDTFNMLVDESFSRLWSRFCRDDSTQGYCKDVIEGALPFLVRVSRSSNDGWRKFILTILLQGRYGLVPLAPARRGDEADVGLQKGVAQVTGSSEGSVGALVARGPVPLPDAASIGKRFNLDIPKIGPNPLMSPRPRGNQQMVLRQRIPRPIRSVIDDADASGWLNV